MTSSGSGDVIALDLEDALEKDATDPEGVECFITSCGQFPDCMVSFPGATREVYVCGQCLWDLQQAGAFASEQSEGEHR